MGEVHELSGWLEWWYDRRHFIFRYKRYIYLSFFAKFYKNQLKLGSFIVTSVLFQKRKQVFL